MRIGATLTTSDASTTPLVHNWSVTYEVGPTPLANILFNMQGSKTIGAGPSGPVYKYSAQHSSGSSGSIAISNVEYDVYVLSVDGATGYDIFSSCAPQPVAVTPGGTTITRLFLFPHTTNSLLVDVKSAAGAVIPNATVRLQRGTYDTTKPTDECGQSFFSGLSSGSVGGGNPYAIEVSANGFAPYSSAEVNVSGTTRLSIILN